LRYIIAIYIAIEYSELRRAKKDIFVEVWGSKPRSSGVFLGYILRNPVREDFVSILEYQGVILFEYRVQRDFITGGNKLSVGGVK